MPRWRLAAALLAGGLATPATAQVAFNHALSYLQPTDVRDARAVWVNPAGLAAVREASVYGEVFVADPGSKGRVRQLSAGFNAGGLSVAYQRDVFNGGERGHTYRIGLAGASQDLAGGVAIARYGGSSGGSVMGWDIGVSYAWREAVVVGGVVANLGQPVVRGIQQRLSYIPSVTWRPVGPAAAVTMHARISPDSVVAYGFGVTWQGGGGGGSGGAASRGASTRWPIAALLRLDTDGGLRRAAFAIGISVGGPDRLGVVLSSPGDVSRLDGAGLYGVSSRSPAARRP